MNRLNYYSQPFVGVPVDENEHVIWNLPMVAPLIRTAIRCSHRIQCGDRFIPAGPEHWNGNRRI